jgi:tRNA-guanine family transglycosylase
VGYPDEIVEYAKMGMDMMDCVLPTRAARHGLLFTSKGWLNIKNRQFIGEIKVGNMSPIHVNITLIPIRSVPKGK